MRASGVASGWRSPPASALADTRPEQQHSAATTRTRRSHDLSWSISGQNLYVSACDGAPLAVSSPPGTQPGPPLPHRSVANFNSIFRGVCACQEPDAFRSYRIKQQRVAKSKCIQLNRMCKQAMLMYLYTLSSHGYMDLVYQASAAQRAQIST